MFITVGLLFLTALYIGMVALLKYLSPLECLDGLCFSEAVDNTILNWASDFFLAFWIFVFALHLSFSTSRNGDTHKSGILSQIFMGGAFVSAGVGHWLYPNSGVDDNRGMLAYWIMRILFAVFFTFSGLGMAHFASSTTENTNNMISVCGIVLFLSMIGFLTGSIWCSSESDLQVIEIVDNIEPTDELHVCFQIMNYSALAMNIAYALLWLPVGTLLKEASQERPVIVMGLPTTIAATIAIVTQWTAGSILLAIVYSISLMSTKIDFLDAWSSFYGTILYHWAMLMTLYCLHNLSYGLPLLYYDSEEEEGGLSPLSWEWWVTMVAGTVPEPEQKANQKKEFDEENNDNMSNSNDATREECDAAKKQVTWEFVEEIDA